MSETETNDVNESKTNVNNHNNGYVSGAYDTNSQPVVYPLVYPVVNQVDTQKTWYDYMNPIIDKIKNTSKASRDISIAIWIVVVFQFIMFTIFFYTYFVAIGHINQSIDFLKDKVDYKYDAIKQDFDLVAKYGIGGINQDVDVIRSNINEIRTDTSIFKIKADFIQTEIRTAGTFLGGLNTSVGLLKGTIDSSYADVKEEIDVTRKCIDEIRTDADILKIKLNFVHGNIHDVRSHLSDIRALLAILNEKIDGHEKMTEHIANSHLPPTPPNMIETEEKQQ